MAPEIPRDRIEVRFSRSGGPGGQHVNKVETKVEIRFVVAEADWLSGPVRARLASLFPTRINSRGELVVSSSRSRSQSSNLEDCFAKLQEMLTAASARRKRRVKTRPTRASRERRLDQKKERGERKRTRRWRSDD